MNFIFRIFTIGMVMLLCNFNCYSISSREVQFKQLWHELEKNNIKIPLWSSNWTVEELEIRFAQLQKDRWSIYFVNSEDFGKKEAFGKWKSIFQMPKNYKSWGSRYPYPIAFLYNLAVSNYNASIITLHGLNFLAMEAPTDKNLAVFFAVLNDYKITDLVRLTPRIYKGREGSFPYWEGCTDIHSISGGPSIEISGREINYFSTDTWEDHQGIEPVKLLALVKAVKNSPALGSKMIAVHCRAGAGRTGAFIAAYTLINDIDQQIASGVDVAHLEINIDKIIWELSLQRAFMLPHFPQYLTLYKLANYYIKTLQN